MSMSLVHRYFRVLTGLRVIVLLSK
jgi:hypothetical protein